MSVIVSDSAIHAILVDWTLGDDKDHAQAHEPPRVRPLAQRQDPDLPDGRARRGVRDPDRRDGDGRRVHLDARGHGGLRRRTRGGGHPPLPRGDAAAAGRGAHEVHPGVRVLLAHARPHRRHRVPQVAGRAGSSSTTSARTCCAPISRSASGALGSLLDHTGPIGEHEKYAARVFGAHRTYCVTNGTSTSNRVIFMAAVGRDQIALCDRNCHKSIEHSLVMTGGIPTYLVPLRNRYGIIGPIPPGAISSRRRSRRPSRPIRWCRRASTRGRSTRSSPTPPTTGSATTRGAWRSCSIPSVDRIHFDEAWYAYARFNPIYRDRHAMHGDPKDHKGPTVFATHSTHKLLAALSQASFLHIRDGRSPIPHARFNESFMMHASTSPLYPIIVSNDITAAMMDGPGGLAAHQRVDPGSGGLPADDGPRPPRSSRRRRTGSSTPGMRTR